MVDCPLSFPIASSLDQNPALACAGSGGGVAAFARENWYAYSGVGDDTLQNILTGGDIRGHDVAAVSDTEAVLFYNDAITSLKAAVLEDDGTLNTALTLSVAPSVAGVVGIQLLTTTRFLAGGITANGFDLFLLGKSGDVMSELDVSTGVESYTVGGWDIVRLSDTKAVAVFGTDALRDMTAYIIDTSGDSITVGTGLTVEDTLAGSYCGVCRMSDNSFILTHSSQVHYLTVSGTTITLEDTIDIDASGTRYLDQTASYIDDNTILVTYEQFGTPADIKANIFTLTGDTLSREDKEITFSNNATFQGWGAVTNLGNRQVMYAHRHDASWTTDGGHATVFTVDNDNNIHLGATIRRSYDGQADHNTIDAAPSGDYVWYLYQDEDTVPAKQLGFRRLKKPTVSPANAPSSTITGSWSGATSQFIIGDEYCYDGTNPVIWSALGYTSGFLVGERNLENQPTISGNELQFDGSSFCVYKNYGFDQTVENFPKNDENHSFYFLLETPATLTGSQRLFVTDDQTAGRNGIEILIETGGALTFALRDNSYRACSIATSMSGSTTYLIMISVDKQAAPTGGATAYLNSDSGVFGAWASDPARTDKGETAPVLGARNQDGTSKLANGYNILEFGWGVGLLDTDTKNAIKSYINAQYSLSL